MLSAMLTVPVDNLLEQNMLSASLHVLKQYIGYQLEK